MVLEGVREESGGSETDNKSESGDSAEPEVKILRYAVKYSRYEKEVKSLRYAVKHSRYESDSESESGWSVDDGWEG